MRGVPRAPCPPVLTILSTRLALSSAERHPRPRDETCIGGLAVGRHAIAVVVRETLFARITKTAVVNTRR